MLNYHELYRTKRQQNKRASEDEKNILTDACKALVIKGTPVHLVRGEVYNMKITTQHDLKVANGLVEGQKI